MVHSVRRPRRESRRPVTELRGQHVDVVCEIREPEAGDAGATVWAFGPRAVGADNLGRPGHLTLTEVILSQRVEAAQTGSGSAAVGKSRLGVTLWRKRPVSRGACLITPGSRSHLNRRGSVATSLRLAPIRRQGFQPPKSRAAGSAPL